MTRLLTYPEIDPQQWQALVEQSPYATWFQTKEAYEFYASLPEEMEPFAIGIEENGILGFGENFEVGFDELSVCHSVYLSLCLLFVYGYILS